MSARKQHKALDRWETDVREWAIDTGRLLVLAICQGEQMPVTPYEIGVVLGAGEEAWVQCPVRFLQDSVPHEGARLSGVWPPTRPWLVTSERLVGRLGDDRLYGWQWDQVIGCRVELISRRERLALDLRDGSVLDWTGPGIAPMAVAAVYHLYGRGALIDHPGLVALRHGGLRSDRVHPSVGLS